MTKQMNQKTYWTGIVTLFLLNACATDPNSCDPKQGGFISGLSAMGSGCYEQRIDRKQEEASTSQSLTDRLNSENQVLEDEKSWTSEQKYQAQQSLDRLQSSNSNLQRKIDSMKANTQSAQSEKARLQRKLQQSKADTARLKQQIKTGTITEKELNQETARLTKERNQTEADASAFAGALLVQ